MALTTGTMEAWIQAAGRPSEAEDGLIGGRFLVDRGLAAATATGGMGTVHRGRDLETGVAVAIKVLRRSGRSERDRFLREAEILAQLDHPAIVRYVAHGVTTSETPYLVTAWVDGETLAARLRRDGLTIADGVRMARRVADALGYGHARGVVHRDIKPANLIFAGGDPRATTVIDYGIARPLAPAIDLTTAGSVVGTPAYMAPEQVQGGRAIDSAADVFALGCVLFECLTGRRAFEGRGVLALHTKIALWDPPRVRSLAPEVPVALEALVARMLAKAPGDRPRDGAAVAALLDEIPAAATAGVRCARGTDPPTVHIGCAAVAAPPVSLVVVTSPHDGATRVELISDAEDGAVRAARCALAIRAAAPDALIAIATGDAREHASGVLLDRALNDLSREAVAMALRSAGPAPVPAGAILVDAGTAEQLGPRVPLIRIQRALYLPKDATP